MSFKCICNKIWTNELIFLNYQNAGMKFLALKFFREILVVVCPYYLATSCYSTIFFFEIGFRYALDIVEDRGIILNLLVTQPPRWCLKSRDKTFNIAICVLHSSFLSWGGLSKLQRQHRYVVQNFISSSPTYTFYRDTYPIFYQIIKALWFEWN